MKTLAFLNRKIIVNTIEKKTSYKYSDPRPFHAHIQNMSSTSVHQQRNKKDDKIKQ